ncbi:uncharacterized protein METZ01_LOCUS394093, partial [marine metagenome]
MKIDDKKYKLICDSLDVFKNINDNFQYSTSGTWAEANVIEELQELFVYLLSTKDRELINKLRFFSSVFPGRGMPPLDEEEFSFYKYKKNKDLDANKSIQVDSIAAGQR